MLTQSPDNEDDNRISVQPRTFKGCTSLKTVELSGAKHWIDKEAFMGCTALESVHSDGGCWVGERAFSGCSSLESFDFGEDEMTQGRAHPMIDPSLRLEAVRAQGADASCGVLLLDLVLGEEQDAKIDIDAVVKAAHDKLEA